MGDRRIYHPFKGLPGFSGYFFRKKASMYNINPIKSSVFVGCLSKNNPPMMIIHIIKNNAIIVPIFRNLFITYDLIVKHWFYLRFLKKISIVNLRFVIKDMFLVN